MGQLDKHIESRDGNTVVDTRLQKSPDGIVSADVSYSVALFEGADFNNAQGLILNPHGDAYWYPLLMRSWEGSEGYVDFDFFQELGLNLVCCSVGLIQGGRWIQLPTDIGTAEELAYKVKTTNLDEDVKETFLRLTEQFLLWKNRNADRITRARFMVTRGVPLPSSPTQFSYNAIHVVAEVEGKLLYLLFANVCVEKVPGIPKMVTKKAGEILIFQVGKAVLQAARNLNKLFRSVDFKEILNSLPPLES